MLNTPKVTLYKHLKYRFPIYGQAIIKAIQEGLYNKVDFKKIRVSKNIKNNIEVY